MYTITKKGYKALALLAASSDEALEILAEVSKPDAEPTSTNAGTRKRKRQIVSNSQKAEMRKLYAAGEDVASLSSAFRCHQSTVQRILRFNRKDLKQQHLAAVQARIDARS